MPKRAESKQEEAFEATVYAAISKAIEVWGREKFVPNKDGDEDEGEISPELVKKKYTAGIRELLYGKIRSTGTGRSYGTEGLDAFLMYCLHNSDPDSFKFGRIRQRFDLWLLLPALESPEYPKTLITGVRNAVRDKRHSSVLGLLSGYFNIQQEESAAAARHVTGVDYPLPHKAKDENRGYYYCYRFSDNPSKVLKTFQVFTPSDREYPYTRFHNFLARYPEDDRISDGVIFELDKYIIGLGRVGNPGRMLKALVLRRPDRNGNLSGLTLSSTNDGTGVLAARVLMKKAEPGVIHHSDAGTGEYSPEQLVEKGELDKMDIWRIRNRIEYSLGGDVRDAETDAPVPNLAALIAQHNDLCEAGVFLRQGPGQTGFREVDFFEPKSNPFDSALKEYSLDQDGRPDD